MSNIEWMVNVQYWVDGKQNLNSFTYRDCEAVVPTLVFQAVYAENSLIHFYPLQATSMTVSLCHDKNVAVSTNHWKVLWCLADSVCPTGAALLLASPRGCLRDTGMSFIPVRNLISYRVYMEVILPEWYEVSCEPSFLQLDFWSVVAYRQACSTRPSQLGHTSRTGTKPRIQNVVRFHTGTNVSYWYENRSELVPVQHFVPVSCKRIQSYK